MNRDGSPFNPAGTHALALAAEKAPGPGMPAPQKAWCCMCDRAKPIKGSTLRGRLRVCADCGTGSRL